MDIRVHELFLRCVEEQGIQVVDHLDIEDRLSVAKTNRFWRRTALNSDWRSLCFAMMKKNSLSPRRWIPGMRVCGSAWDSNFNIEYLPKLAANLCTLDDIVFALKEGVSNRHWRKFFNENVAPCSTCSRCGPRSTRPLPVIEKQVVLRSYEIEYHDKMLDLWTDTMREVEKRISCIRALEIVVKSNKVCWSIRGDPDNLTIYFDSIYPENLRRASQALAPLDTVERMEAFLKKGAPGYDISVYGGATRGGGSGSIVLLNFHGFACCTSHPAIEFPIFNPFKSQYFDRGTPSGANLLMDRHSKPQITERFGWVNEEEQQFIHRAQPFRGVSAGFFVFEATHTSTGTTYAVLCPNSGERIMNFDELG